ncbi:uncharacterized protein [Porites lutea]|uniref:uncharacterized protein n=1 Tax=Porites lutea TaxID=51062 RepID=UPI003CC5E9F7
MALEFFIGKREMAVNTKYGKSVQGLLKILELITICVAFSCLADFKRELEQPLGRLSDKFSVRFVFFMAVFVTGWVVVLVVFLVFLFSLTKKDLNLALLIFSALFALLFFIASGLMTEFLNDVYDAQWHKIPPFKKFSDLLTVSVVFGFVSGFLLAVDGFLLCSKSKIGAN